MTTKKKATKETIVFFPDWVKKFAELFDPTATVEFLENKMNSVIYRDCHATITQKSGFTINLALINSGKGTMKIWPGDTNLSKKLRDLGRSYSDTGDIIHALHAMVINSSVSQHPEKVVKKLNTYFLPNAYKLHKEAKSHEKKIDKELEKEGNHYKAFEKVIKDTCETLGVDVNNTFLDKNYKEMRVVENTLSYIIYFNEDNSLKNIRILPKEMVFNTLNEFKKGREHLNLFFKN